MNCETCKHFKEPKFSNPEDAFIITEEAKCRKGNKLRFMLPKGIFDTDYGYKKKDCSDYIANGQ